jgi:hypothetical protein
VDVNPFDVQPRFVFAFGGLMEYWVSPSIAFQFNALYNPKGAKYSYDINGGSIDLYWKFNYLSFPILAKFAFGQKTKLYFAIGPELAFLLSANWKMEATGSDDTIEEDVKDHMNGFEFAINSGLGLEIPINNLILFIESRGAISITDIYKDKTWVSDEFGPVELEDKTAMNGIAGLHLGLIF